MGGPLAISSTSWELRFRPRRWQEQALRAWAAAGDRGIVEVVTGAGKTAFAEMCIADYQIRNPTGSTLVIVPTLALVDQWFVALTEDLGLAPTDIALFTGESHPPRLALVNVATINTAREGLGPRARHPRFLVVDECHRAASPENRRALDGEYAATLGLSATPERQYDTGLEDVLVPKLGEVIFRYGYPDAQRDGTIVPFELINAGVALTPGEQTQYEKLTRRVARLMKDRDEEQLILALRRRSRLVSLASMRVPATVKLLERHRGQRCIVFHESIKAADAIVERVTSRGGSAIAYHTGIGPVTRRENLRLYRRGVFDILVTCRALDEGVNVPETTVGVIASSTASIRQRIQRLGRVLRPSHGKDVALVYTIYATALEEKRLAAEAERGVGARSVQWIRLRTNV